MGSTPSAKAKDGVPGLYMALQNGRTDTVKAFTEEVTKLVEAKLLTTEGFVALVEHGRDGRFCLLRQNQRIR